MSEVHYEVKAGQTITLPPLWSIDPAQPQPQPLKLFVIGGSFPDGSDWGWKKEWAVVLAHDEEEAMAIGHAECLDAVTEIPMDEAKIVCGRGKRKGWPWK